MHTTVNCPDRESLRQFMLGEVPDPAAGPLDSHIAECEGCNARIEQLAAEDRLVVAMRSRSPILSNPDHSVVDRLVAGARRLHPATCHAETPVVTETVVSASERSAHGFLDPPQEAGELGRLGPWPIVQVLGSGGMAIVFLARDDRLKRRVAIKVIQDGRFKESQYLARFQREAEALARLRHPNIVQIHEVGSLRGRPYLVLEYVDGGTLADLLGGQPRPVRPAAEFLVTLARAMSHAHQLSVVHRDLKPANVLLQGSGIRDQGLGRAPQAESQKPHFSSLIPKISDFGLARRLDEAGLTQTGDFIGTPSYLAPELTRGHGTGAESGPRVDVYSLGAIFYELLTGRPPFRGETVIDTLDQARSLDPVAPRRLRPGLPRDLETICLKCLAREPDRRYASAAELADDLQRFLDGHPILARPASVPQRLARWARRRPAAAALLAVSALSLVGLVGGAAVYEHRLRGALEQSETERHRADANYREARAAMRRMLDRLEQRRGVDIPQLKELHQAQLEDALQFYQAVLKELADADPAVRRDVAEAYQETGRIQNMLGQYDAARENFTSAIALWQQLADESPAAADARANLALNYAGLAFTHFSRAENEQAEPYFRQSLELREALFRSDSENADRQDQLAEGHLHMGRVGQALQRPSFDAHYQQAADLWEALAGRFPDQPQYARSAANACNHLGVIFTFSQRPEQAEAALRKAESFLEPLVKDNPLDHDYVVLLASIYQAGANLRLMTQRPEEALGHLARAQQLIEPVLRQEPRLVTARTLLLNIHGARAQTWSSMGRYRESIADWDRVVELSEERDRPEFRALRAVIQALVGDHAQAAAEAEQAGNDPLASAPAIYHSARALAASSKAVAEDATLSGTERSTKAETYAARAVVLLAEARNAGLFQDAANIEAMKQEPEIILLAARDDFQKLLREIEGK